MQRKREVLVGIALSSVLLTACGGDDPPNPNQTGAGLAQPLFATDHKIIDRRVEANPQRNAYFADLHVHTKYSFDAYAFGTLATPYAAKAVVSESADFQDGAAPVRHIGTGRCQQRTATATSDNQRLDQCGR